MKPGPRGPDPPRDHQTPQSDEDTMNGDYLSPADIRAGLPAELQAFWGIESAPIHRDASAIVQALWDAARILLPVMRSKERVIIVMAASPFQLNLGTGMLTFTPHEHIWSSCLEHFIFLDVPRLIPLKYPAKVAGVLEELVHVVFNIADEHLVKQVVAALYPGITYVNGQYHVPG
jgi:hypothetical protein